jgi:hypothetical protein
VLQVFDITDPGDAELQTMEKRFSACVDKGPLTLTTI